MLFSMRSKQKLLALLSIEGVEVELRMKSSLIPASLMVLLLLGFPFLAQTALSSDLSRHDFPSNFVFGAGTSAFQYEGAVAEDGRAPSILDIATQDGWGPDKINGCVSADGYHKYKEDVQLMSDTGLEAYRFSISWSRLIPYGRGTINLKAVEYYNNVLDELIKQGISPHATLSHLDHPQVLQDEYGGWSSLKIVDDFKEFAEVCFREFGNKIPYWTTINEPNMYGIIGNVTQKSSCIADNSTILTYVIVHNMLIAHSEVVRLYRTKYQHYQRGWIGLNIYAFWSHPFSNSFADAVATERVKDFMFGWILNPIVFGDYPEIMKKIASSRLPSFTESESEALKGSFDFIGMNYYTSVYISDYSNSSKDVQGFKPDMAAIMRVNINDPPACGAFLPTHVPSDFSGLQKMMEYVKASYGNPPVYIQENGYSMGANNVFNDTERVAYLKGYIGSTFEAMRNGVDVRGYFVWSFVDCFEFLGGYKRGFGLYHVDFDDENRPRTPKLSAQWYSEFLKKNTTSDIEKAGLKYMSLASMIQFVWHTL